MRSLAQLFKLSTDKTVRLRLLQTAVEADRFGVMQIYNLKETKTKNELSQTGISLASGALRS